MKKRYDKSMPIHSFQIEEKVQIWKITPKNKFAKKPGGHALAGFVILTTILINEQIKMVLQAID